jgi:integrase
MTVVLVEDWEKYASIRKWKKNIISKNHNKVLTKQAWTVRRSSFTKFLKMIGKNPDEIIDIALSDNDQAKEWVDEFYQECLKTTQKSSSISSAYGVIRGFFSNNDVITQNWSSPKIGVLQSHITDEQNPIFVRNDNGYELDREFIKKYLDELGLRDRIICLCLLSSSLDISDVLNLKIEDVKYQKDDNFFIIGQRSKTGEIYKTFFSKETTSMIREYIQKERKSALEHEILFIPENRMLGREYKKVTGKNLFVNRVKVAEFPITNPMSHENLDMLFRRATKRLKIQTKKGQFQPFRPKRFRHTFQQCCSRVGLPNTVVDIFMGHKGEINKQYETESKFELLDYYEQVEPMITIYEDISKDSKITELEKKISLLEEKKENISDFGDEMLFRIKKLEQDNEDLRNYLV